MIFSTLRITKLCRDISGYKNIYLYGAGQYAAELGRLLESNNIFVKGYIVTGGRGKQNQGLEPVYTIREGMALLEENNTTVIIAVDRQKEIEIENLLKSLDIKNYFRINDYFREYAPTDMYQNMLRDEYLNEISEFMQDTRGLSYADVFEDLKGSISDAHKNRRHVVFLIEFVEPRTLKMQKALLAAGFEVTVLVRAKIGASNGVLDEIIRLGTRHYIFEWAEEAMYRLIKSDAAVVHVFTDWAYCSLAYILINQKRLFPKIVVERYDLQNGMYYGMWNRTRQEFERVLLLERFCLEKADGVCFRCFGYEYLIDELDFDFHGKVIHFMDFFLKDEMVTPSDTGGDELSLGYAGGITPERIDPAAPLACFLELAKKCEMNKCHLHVYPVCWDEDRLEDFIRLDSESDYFHLHRPVKNGSLFEEMSHYDYLINPLRKTAFSLKKTVGRNFQKSSKYIYCATNKLFDGLCAGLPLIAANPVKLLDGFEKNGMLIRWTVEEYDFEELRRRKKEMKENVLKNRDKFMMENHINELIDFYDSL